MEKKTGIVHLKGIDTIRMVSAFMVIVFHATALPKLTPPNIVAAILPYFGMAVPLFFAVSGFIIAYVYQGKLSENDSIINFYIKRFFRIAPLFYSMLVVWMITAYIVWDKLYPFSEIIINLSFLFNNVPNQQESIVWAGWSIGVEMIFYFLFPLISLFTTNVRCALIGLVLSLLLAMMAHAQYTEIGVPTYGYMNSSNQFCYFMSGMLAFHIWCKSGFRQSQKAVVIRTLLMILAIAIVVGIVASNLIFIGNTEKYRQGGWCIAFVVIILAICYWQNPLVNNKLFNYLGAISFSLYLVHPFIIQMLVFLKFYSFLEQYISYKTYSYLFSQVGTVLITIGISSLTYFYIEKRGIALGSIVIKQRKHFRKIILGYFWQRWKREMEEATHNQGSIAVSAKLE
ncbi:Acyltransferase family protein [Legionella massiliensis]|uniref:Acyltransferase family protein n=1 Tax=Legionella massiliensis TaxID=1034943 RepID=A0A078KWS3_9GAMM|nr:acyltransferase [Legionella massiliensis]CDZ76214.1 Acyltransferase family protein [Legionella massiliensis]CEE11952.1 Acyltransferase family protein [Legionella massiliensis]